MGYVHVEREMAERDGRKEIMIRVSNFSRSKKEIKVYEMCSGDVRAEGARITGSGYITVSWNIVLRPEEEVELRYTLKGRVLNKKPLIEGVDRDILSGGETMDLQLSGD